MQHIGAPGWRTSPLGKNMKYIIALLCFVCSLASAQQITNTTYTPLPSALQTAATVNSGVQQNANYRGGHFIINVSSYNIGTYTPHIQGLDPVSGNWYDILVGPGISAIGTTIIKVYPGIGASTNAASPDILPLNWRVQLIGTSTPSMTISVDAYLEL